MKRMRTTDPGRPRVGYVPEWSGPIEGWVVRQIERNLWRVQPAHSREDLKQDAYYYFLRMKDRYPEVIEAPHFMALFKRSYSNHIHVLALQRTRRGEVQGNYEHDGDAVDVFQAIPSREDVLAETELRIWIEEAPAAVKKVLQELDREEPAVYLRVNGIRETTRTFLERLAGRPEGVDVIEQAKRWLLGVPQCR